MQKIALITGITGQDGSYLAEFREFEASGKQVLITEHAYAPEYDQTATSGQYCVQFMTFTRDGGELVRQWWEDRCIEWCFARFEEGKFGDQKYLDDWQERFPREVHVLADKELALAPWNAMGFPYGRSVFWHFHSLRIVGGSGGTPSFDLGPYFLPRAARQHVYVPYLEDLRTAINRLAGTGASMRVQLRRSAPGRVKALLRGLVNLFVRPR